MDDSDSMKLLILAGGQSSRMGSPKHLLPIPSTNQPLYQQLVHVMHIAFPETHTIHFSVTDNSALDDVLQQGEMLLPTKTGPRHVGLKRISDKAAQNIGPAAGLIAAHRYDQNANWVVVACDFPLLDPAALCQLRESYQAPITCFVNSAGFSEPLLAVWGPEALRKLLENVEAGRSGPNYTVKQLKGKLIAPTEHDWILNTNTREEWDVARLRIKQPQSIEGT
ncbi:hypothetical protein EKO04_009888 [Ascochyta lentis]|uniref:MobA-like NTP transferase domain-containing protein n=1 Tax=Ascochyta lentis TaxID=205686 RepID=A0A8H7MBU5_9PLEO|nr:hypothetical protein EKO04_009888 [Ascochyta lentis]